MTPAERMRLAGAVQRNCDVADARHARELSLCIYLLQMRELYRWQQGLALGGALRHAEVGAWLDSREALWEDLADAGYAMLELDGERIDAFDAAAVNARLQPHGLVYGAGRLASGRPLFVLAELQHSAPREGLQVRVAGTELARGLAAPPGLLQGDAVLLRRDALLRWLWELHEAWSPKRRGPFGAALAACARPGDSTAQVLARMADEQIETLLLHEIGEHRAGALLGPDWAALRQATGGDRRIEPRLRALRDHLADCLVTLPTLRERGAAASLHFWFAGLDGLRLALFPRLQAAYAAWCGGDDGAALDAALAAGRDHWQRLGARALALHRSHGAACAEPLAALLDGDDARC